jgi:membrane protein YqaA with SNARE-associated domain
MTAIMKRDPVRATTLLGVGCLAGGVAGWLLGRSTGAPPVAGARGSA